MLKTYKTRVGFTIVCGILLAFMIAPLTTFLLDDGTNNWWSYGGSIIVALLAVASINAVVNIRYVIFNDELIVKSGSFAKDQHYKIADITEIKKTSSVLSAPAGSLKRIALTLRGQKNPLVISPRNEADFIAQLKSINPEIKTF